MARAMGVVGAGTMGVGIAYVFAAVGFAVTVVEPDAARATALMDVVGHQAERGVERGKLSDSEAAELPARIRRVTGIAALPEGLDVIVESVPERIELKHAVVAEAERRHPLLLASNTSSLSIDSLAVDLERPATFLGMHFFNPVWSLPLVEIIRGGATDEQALEAAGSLVAAIHKQAIIVRDVPGFATSRLDFAAALEAMRMLEDGVASAEDIDRAAVLAYRHPVGPLRLSDIVGLDVRLATAESLSATYGDRFAPPRILREMVGQGKLGEKSGHGFFDWS